jgi:hypothetical protein
MAGGAYLVTATALDKRRPPSNSATRTLARAAHALPSPQPRDTGLLAETASTCGTGSFLNSRSKLTCLTAARIVHTYAANMVWLPHSLTLTLRAACFFTLRTLTLPESLTSDACDRTQTGGYPQRCSGRITLMIDPLSPILNNE